MKNNNLTLSQLGHTWIIDLDGTILKHNGYKIDGRDSFLDGAKDFLNKIPDKDMIIFVTSRTEEYRSITEKFLNENSIRYNHLIFNAPYGERILINDGKPSGLNTAISVCTERDKWPDIIINEDASL